MLGVQGLSRTWEEVEQQVKGLDLKQHVEGLGVEQHVKGLDLRQHVEGLGIEQHFGPVLGVFRGLSEKVGQSEGPLEQCALWRSSWY